MNGPKQPAIDAALLEWLDVHFPDKCPRISDTDREIWGAVGARKVIDHLKSLHQSQLEKALAAKK